VNYDAVLIHPPSIYDFRKKVINEGPIALTVQESTRQFIIPSIGMLSIADYLDRNGYKVIVDNLGDRMMADNGFDVESYLRALESRVFAVELHWCVHSQGAIEVAKLLKKLHPHSMVILGGLTSSIFAEEIIRKYDFIDAVIRGEAEKPFLELMKALEKNDGLENVPSLTFRDSNGEIIINDLLLPNTSIDEYEFTRLDLIEPKHALFPKNSPSHWSIPVCRGCTHNCVTCGGSRYSYKRYFGRICPAFRSPDKIAQDIKKLSDQGIKQIFLFQDPRMGGREYWIKLMQTLQNTRINLTQLTMEIWGPADEEYIRELSKIRVPLVLTISPESCVESVRGAHGRKYSNVELFDTIRLCKKYNIAIAVFSMIALAKDTPETIKKNWEVWEEICKLNSKTPGRAPAMYSFGPMILLDPGSQAFDYPDKYGYRLRFKNLEDYVSGMSFNSWYQWISYETACLNRNMIIKSINNSIGNSIDLMEKYGICSKSESENMRYHLQKDEMNYRINPDTLNTK
jgi:B12-binding domain/radical SAM domain protein